jgi:hypothetical protein
MAGNGDFLNLGELPWIETSGTPVASPKTVVSVRAD